MASEPVQPLRIAKSTPSSSPAKMAGSLPRPLSEISPAEKRRNSPSWHQHTPTKGKPVVSGNDSSPFQSSPLDFAASPRHFWQSRNAENISWGGSGSPSSTRRTSIERLQRASRVSNSNILALEQRQEYDPTRLPHIERPLAKVQEPAGASSSGSGALRSPDSEQRPLDGKPTLSTMSPSKSSPTLAAAAQGAPRAPSKDQASPTKSSLSPSKFHKSTFDPEAGTWSRQSSLNEHELPEGRFLHRHPKSVTFDAAPPQINEYEMATPDLSSIGTNSREGSYESVDDEDDDDTLYESGQVDVQDDSFDESLEDTNKTPVVGPEDWRGESPMVPHRMSPQRLDDSPMPESVPSVTGSDRPAHLRTDSANSNPDHRPLPPLPGSNLARSQSPGAAPASPGLSATAERMLGGTPHRSLPVPPPASASKSDIQSFGNGKMTLEERLKLMMLSDDGGGSSNTKTAAEQQRERRLRRGAGRDRGETPPQPEPESAADLQVLEEDDVIDDISLLGDYHLPSRISRESIMRRVDGNKALEGGSEHDFSPAATPISQRSPERSPHTLEALDPDIPIPSTEDPVTDDEAYEKESSVIITRDREDHGGHIDFYHDSDSNEDGLHPPHADDDESHYSENEPEQEGLQSKHVGIEATTPRATSPDQYLSFDRPTPGLSPAAQASAAETAEGISETIDKAETASEKERVLGVEKQGSSTSIQRPHTPEENMSKPEYDGSGWGEPEDESYDEPGTPDSVIHHSIPGDDEPHESPTIPERIATVKSAAGSKLKTRVSNTPSDLAAMREARRQVSQEVPSVPPIPERHRNRNSRDFAPGQDCGNDEYLARHPSYKNRSLTLDLDMGLSLGQDLERVIEAQKVDTNHAFLQYCFGAVNIPHPHASQSSTEKRRKELDANVTFRPQRGYLMRQNTSLVSASDKEGDTTWRTRSANNSPVKKDRPQSWTVEPWNGHVRHKSSRKRLGTSGPVPPLPGQESNAATLNQVVEEDVQSEAATVESGERGRLFVKVMSVKDLDLPLPKNERTWFSLTLDNGVHCVTTAWLELARNAPIGQEFELVVPNDLEFQLTLNVKLEKPAHTRVQIPVAKMNKPKTSTFSRVFASPKKRRQLEQQQKAEEERYAQQQREMFAQRNNSPSGYELLSPLVAEDGSFARAYVCLKEHENRCFGRPHLTEVVCFNEWATEEESFASSVKSKRGNTGVVRQAPYSIGKLELQLLFVPRPKNTTEEEMPKSMNSCMRELRAAEERLAHSCEGHLSQQGGDCPYWRRRYFKIVGIKLTAYHESTHQPRATINLGNAKRLIDDRRSLIEKETTGKGGKRRRSAFAEDEEGYMFIEEGFRIRFNNGEVIDFYADTAADKEAWMRVLSEVIGRGDSGAREGTRSRAKWCEVVLRREEQVRRRTEGRRVHSRTKSTLS